MSTRKPFGPHRREKKFFVIGTKGAGQDYWTFYTSLRFVDRHPGKAKRFYSKKSAEAFKAEADRRDNPYMVRAVLKAVETEQGIDIHVPALKKNPSPGLRERSDRLHKLRLKLLAQLKKAERKGSGASGAMVDGLRHKLIRLDSLIHESAAKFFSRKFKKR